MTLSLMFKKDEDARVEEWDAYSGGLHVANIKLRDDELYYEPDKPWVWQMQDIQAGPDAMEIHGYQGSLDECKAAILDNFKKWLTWAELI